LFVDQQIFRAYSGRWNVSINIL